MPMTALRIFPAPGDNNELIFIIIPPWVPVHSSQPYACFRYMGVTSEKKSSLIFLFSRYVVLSLCALSVVTLWGEDEWNRSEVVRGTDDSRVIMTSRKAAQGLLRLHARHSSRGHHKDVLWALLYLDSPVHRAPRGTQPNWAGHCTQEDFQEEYLPFHPNIHTYCCSSCIFWCYNKHISKHHQTLILCHPTCISSPWGYVQLVYTLPRDICEHR